MGLPVGGDALQHFDNQIRRAVNVEWIGQDKEVGVVKCGEKRLDAGFRAHDMGNVINLGRDAALGQSFHQVCTQRLGRACARRFGASDQEQGCPGGCVWGCHAIASLWN